MNTFEKFQAKVLMINGEDKEGWGTSFKLWATLTWVLGCLLQLKWIFDILNWLVP